jgi:hypothetical protein
MPTMLLTIRSYRSFTLRAGIYNYRRRGKRHLLIIIRRSLILLPAIISIITSRNNINKDRRRICMLLISIGELTLMMLSMASFMTPRNKPNIKSIWNRKESSTAKTSIKSCQHHTFIVNR